MHIELAHALDDGHHHLPAEIINNGTPQADKNAIAAFLYRFRRSPHTLRRYTTELTRLWLWAQFHGKLISQLTPTDFELYDEFLRNPQPASTWVMTKRYPRNDPRWRPFTGPLNLASVKHAFAAIQSLMTAWVRSGYLSRDPLANKTPVRLHMTEATPANTTRPPTVHTRDKWFDAQMATAIRNVLRDMPTTTERERRLQLQYSMIIRILTVTGMRVSEAVHATQGALHERRSGWWLTVIGKGAVERSIPLPTSYITEVLVPWRTAHGLPSLPTPGETTPLLPPQFYKSGKPSISARMTLNIVKDVCSRAAATLPVDAGQAASLLGRASNHWFRHTYATQLIDHDVPVKSILDTLGQKSEQVLRNYDHKNEDSRYNSIVSVSRSL